MINLNQIIQQYPKASNDPKLMRSLLLDLYPREKKRDIYILVSFIECGIVDELQKNIRNINTSEKLNYLNKIEDEYGFSQFLCEPILELWINAINTQKKRPNSPIDNNNKNTNIFLDIYNEICAIILTVIEMEMNNEIHGINSISAVIRGADNQKTRSYKLDRLENFGILSDITFDHSEKIISYALEKRWLDQIICQDGFPRIIVTISGQRLLTYTRKIMLVPTWKHFKNEKNNNLAYFEQREKKLSGKIKNEVKKYQSYIYNGFRYIIPKGNRNQENKTKSQKSFSDNIYVNSIPDINVTKNHSEKLDIHKTATQKNFAKSFPNNIYVNSTSDINVGNNYSEKLDIQKTVTQKQNNSVSSKEQSISSYTQRNNVASDNNENNHISSHKPETYKTPESKPVSDNTYPSGWKNPQKPANNYENSKSPTPRDNKQSPENHGSIKWIIGVIAFMLLLAWCSSNNSNSTTTDIRPSATIITKQSTATAEIKLSFITHKMTIDIGQNYKINYKPGGSASFFKIRYNKSMIRIQSKVSTGLIIEGIQDGKTDIHIVDKQGNIIDTCTVTIKTNQKTPMPSNTPVPTKQIIEYAPTSSEWGFDNNNLKLTVGESFELHYSTPEHAIYTYNFQNLQIIDYIDKGNNTLLITGKTKGFGKINLYNSNNALMDTCTINVYERQTSTPIPSPTKPNPTKTPVPLTNKKGGYSENELIQYGYIPTTAPDGSIKFSGFYQAPNGNYYKPNP